MAETLAEAANRVQAESADSLVAANSAGNFFWTACLRGDSCEIGAAVSKGCGKFPAPRGHRILSSRARFFFAQAQNSSVEAGKWAPASRLINMYPPGSAAFLE